MIFKNRFPYGATLMKDPTGHYIGWKIHLAVSPKNQKFVLEWLKDNKNCTFPFKQGEHGGQTGKDFTIYIGDWNSLKYYTQTIESNLRNLLMRPEGDALDSDIVLNSCVAARFDTAYGSDNFHPLGKNKGIPLSKRHYLPFSPSKEELDTNLSLSIDDLVEEFGQFFGSKEEIMQFYR